MSRRPRRPALAPMTAAERAAWLEELRSAPRGVQTVDVDDEPDALSALFAGRQDTSAIDAGDRANERAAWRQS